MNKPLLKFNAKNLLFYEDTASKLKEALASNNDIDRNDYNFKIENQESLHAHCAVVYDQKTP